MGGDDFSDPELQHSEETEDTDDDDYRNDHHGGSQQLHQGEVCEAADEVDIERKEEVEENIKDDDNEEDDGEVEEEEEGDETTGDGFGTTNGEVAAGEETESNANDLAEDIAAPITELSRQETEPPKFGPRPNLFPQQRSKNPDLFGYLDAIILLLFWILSL